MAKLEPATRYGPLHVKMGAPARIKVVMLTALAKEVEWREASAVGADDILTKPFCPIALVERIDELLAL